MLTHSTAVKSNIFDCDIFFDFDILIFKVQATVQIKTHLFLIVTYIVYLNSMYFPNKHNIKTLISLLLFKLKSHITHKTVWPYSDQLFPWRLTFSATSLTEATDVPYRFSLYCPASMNKWFCMSRSICSRDDTKW